MKAACLIPLALLVIFCPQADAVDLSLVPRSINTEPEYETQPKYGLLVFAPEATTRVWLVHDGNRLFADLNGNGDLTEAGERFAAHEQSDADEGRFRFDIGDVREGELLHKSLSVMTMNLQGLASSEPQVRQALERDPQAHFYRIGMALQMPIHRGTGIDGRIEHLAGPIDAGGLLRFADSPDEAPIIHFGGPWQITLFGGDATVTAGRQTEVFLGLGTPGLGPGTTAFAAYQDLVPAGKFPKLHVTLPGDDAQTIEFVLRERCCTVNFHGGVRLPEDARTGEATVRISLDDWIGGFAAPTTHQVKIVKPRTAITLEPVSPRLKGSLVHASRDGDLVGVKYSPDGRRIIAGNYPGGTIQVWDVETGEPLTTMETGYGYGSTTEYFHLAPDWQTLYVVRRDGELTRIERDGKRFNRWNFDGDIRCWNPATGELRSRLQHSPPRNIIAMALSPDGKSILTGDELPGEYEGRPPRRLSLWNLETGSRHEFAEASSHSIFSADCSRCAFTEQTGDFATKAFKVCDTRTGKESLTIPVDEQPSQSTVMNFADDDSLLIGRMTTMPDLRDRSTHRCVLKFWNTASGEEVGTIPAKNPGEVFSWPATLSPDGRTYVLGNWRGARAELYFIDIERRQIATTVDLGANAIVRGQVFSPDGRWIAAATQHSPANMTAYTTAEDLPQPRIHLIESATGKIRETIVAPQCFLGSLCFSPDGNTLASSGPGRVLLWDLSTLPAK